MKNEHHPYSRIAPFNGIKPELLIAGFVEIVLEEEK
jgi:hypothetical protein